MSALRDNPFSNEVDFSKPIAPLPKPIRVPTVRRTKPLKCYFCGETISRGCSDKAKNAGVVEIYSAEPPPFKGQQSVAFPLDAPPEVRGAISYPAERRRLEGWRYIVIVAHRRCGPDGSYWFSFSRVHEDWEQHMCGKAWDVRAELAEVLSCVRGYVRLRGEP